MPKTNAVARSLVLIDASVFEQRYLVALLEDMPCHDVDVVLLGARAVVTTDKSLMSSRLSLGLKYGASAFVDPTRLKEAAEADFAVMTWPQASVATCERV